MRSTSRRYLFLPVGILGLGYFFYKFRNSITLKGFRWAVVGESLRHANIPLLLAAILLIYGCFAIRAVRWMRFSRSIGETHFWNVYRATLMGFSCTFLLGRAGEPVRPVLIARKDSLPIPHMFGVYVLERVFDMAAAVILAATALILFQTQGMAAGQGSSVLKIARSAGVALLVGFLVVAGFLVYFRFHGGAWLAKKLEHESWRKGWREKAAVLLEGFSDGLRGIRTAGDLLALMGHTALHWVGVVLAYLWIFHGLRGQLGGLSLLSSMLVLAFTLVGSAAQLPGVGGGAQAASFLVLTLILGVDREPAAVGAIIVWLITFASCSLVGLPLLVSEGWSMGELRQMAKAEEQAGEAALLEEAEHAGHVDQQS